MRKCEKENFCYLPLYQKQFYYFLERRFESSIILFFYSIFCILLKPIDTILNMYNGTRITFALYQMLSLVN